VWSAILATAGLVYIKLVRQNSALYINWHIAFLSRYCNNKF